MIYEYSTIDFYMASVHTGGTFHDMWNGVIWSNCYELIERKWQNEILYLPNNYKIKLKRRYGADWRTPKDTKGPVPRKKII